jgi:hypothetical protein
MAPNPERDCAFETNPPHRKSPQMSPIFIGDSATLHVSREKDGKLPLVDAR